MINPFQNLPPGCSIHDMEPAYEICSKCGSQINIAQGEAVYIPTEGPDSDSGIFCEYCIEKVRVGFENDIEDAA